MNATPERKPLIFHSNAAWAQTGYGCQTAMFVPRIADLGYDVAISAFWGLGGSMLKWGEFTVYPADEQWGNLTLGPIASHWGRTGNIRDTLVITLMDVWILTAPALADLRLAAWTPVDHDPVPKTVEAFFRRTGARPIAMSRFGQDRLDRLGLKPLYVPHGVDTTIFKPAPAEERARIREAMSVPEDAFVVGMVANNKGIAPPRKGFGQMFEAFRNLLYERPESYLYLHSKKVASDGVNLPEALELHGVPLDRVRWANDFALEIGIPTEAMAMTYNGFDVLACPSYGEGFGIPIMEAQACGVPVIVGSWTAMHELCGSGWRIDGERYYDASQGSWFFTPSIQSLTIRLLEAYDARGDESMSFEARRMAMDYDADFVRDMYWRPVLEQLDAEYQSEQEMPAVSLRRWAA